MIERGLGGQRTVGDDRAAAISGRTGELAVEAFNVADLRAKLTAMEPTTWRLIRDEVLTRLPQEVNVTPSQPVLLKGAFAAGTLFESRATKGKYLSMY